MSFKCPKCQRVTYNPHDVKSRYCGNCHSFFLDTERKDDSSEIYTPNIWFLDSDSSGSSSNDSSSSDYSGGGGDSSGGGSSDSY